MQTWKSEEQDTIEISKQGKRKRQGEGGDVTEKIN